MTEQRLRELAAENWSGIAAAFPRAGIEADLAAKVIEAEVGQARATCSDQAAAILESADQSVSEADLMTLADRLARRFLTEINDTRQRDLGTNIWRSVDDPSVRTTQSGRDDRLFSWHDRFSDGHSGHGCNCRCTGEPAILDSAILLILVTLSEDLSSRIAEAQGAGLADAAAGGVQTRYSTLRFCWLGYQRQFGVTSPEEGRTPCDARPADPDHRHHHQP